MTYKKKIAYILPSHAGNALPSTRISVLNMLPYLKNAGFDPHIVFEPSTDTEEPDVTGLADRIYKEGFDIAYFQKVHGNSVQTEMAKLSSLGVKTVYGVCDLINNKIAAIADATVVVTPYLKSLYEPALQRKIHVVHDGIEKSELHIRQYRDHYATRNNPINAVLVTSESLSSIPNIKAIPDFVNITVIGRYPTVTQYNRLKSHYWVLRSTDSWRNKMDYFKALAVKKFTTINWDIDNVYKYLLAADIGIIPVNMKENRIPGFDVSYWQVKSENRLTLKMALGLPVIASPVPSYMGIINGDNGFIAHTEEQWYQYFTELKDPKMRKSVGIKARQSVLTMFSKESQAQKLVRLLNRLLGDSQSDSRNSANEMNAAGVSYNT